MARVSLDPPRTLGHRLGAWYSRRRFGAELEPATVLAHHPQVMRSNVRGEMALARWKELPRTLNHLAVMAAAVTVGCAWCVDFGYWIGVEDGTDPRKIHDVPRWRESTVFTDLERRVIEYAEAASLTPPTVTDEMVERLRADLTDAQLVELTMLIAVENQRARFNSALGLTAQGFRDRCEVPA
jgi:AhpD family alkylhydroperoxidase